MGFFEKQKFQVEVKKPKAIHNCQTCPLDKATQHKIKGQGNNKILVLTAKELDTDRFSWLCEQLDYNEIDVEDCWFSSVAQCEHKGEASNKVINCCRQQWQAQIKELKPEKILLFGQTVLKAFVGDRMNDIGEMNRWVGWSIPDQDYQCWVYPLYDIDFIKDNKNEAAEYVFQDHLVNALEHKEEFKQHYETINVITDVKEAIKYLENIGMTDSKWLSFDYEGTGLKPYRKEQELVSVSFATDSYSATSFPIFKDKAFLASLKKPLYYPLRKTAHQIQFEQKWTRHKLGYEPEGLAFCSMLACHILDNRTHISRLKFQVYIRYGVAGYDNEINPFLEGLKDGEDEKSDNRLNRIHEAPLNDLLYYGGLDSMFGYRLTMDQIKELTEKGLDDVYDFFFDGVLALANVTENGMHIDEKYFNQVHKQLTDELDQLEHKIHNSKEGKAWKKFSGKDLEISKDNQTKKLVIEVLKLKLTKTTKGSKKENPTYSVDKEVLKELSEKHPFFADIIKWRETFKIRGTYVEGFLRESIDGLIHPNQNLHTTVTYRPSTTSPNFANIPKRDKEAQKLIRTGVIPSKGNIILTVDYSQAEVRAGCFYHKDPVMMDYVISGKDMHYDEAKNSFLLSDELMHKDVRNLTKGFLVFAEFYGDYWKQVAKNMWAEAKKVSIADKTPLIQHLANQGIRNYKSFEQHIKEVERVFWKEKFKVFDQWKAEAWERYLELGYIEYLTGFRCGGILDRKNVVNYPFQGTAFHLLLWSLIELEHETRTQGWRSKVCLQVYDEMMFDVCPDELDDLVPLIRDVMTKEVRKQFEWINVPLGVEIKTSKINGNWFEMEEYKG